MNNKSFFKENKKGILLLAIILVVARISSILYSFFATNKPTSEYLVVDILYYTYNILTALLIPSLIAFVLINVYEKKIKGAKVLVTSFLFIFIDRAICVVYDAVTVGLSGQALAAILFNIAISIHSFLFVLFAYIVITKYEYKYASPKATDTIKKKYSKLNALLVSYLGIFVVCLLRVLYNIFSFLIEYSFNVYPEEVSSMIQEVLFVLLTRALIPAIIGLIVLKPFKKETAVEVEND